MAIRRNTSYVPTSSTTKEEATYELGSSPGVASAGAAVGPVRIVRDMSFAKAPPTAADAMYELAGSSEDYDVYEV